MLQRRAEDRPSGSRAMLTEAPRRARDRSACTEEEQPSADRDDRDRAAIRRRRRGAIGSRWRVRGTVTGPDVTPAVGRLGRARRRGTRACAALRPRTCGIDVAGERFEAVGRRVVAEPEHELAAAGVDELLHLLGHLLAVPTKLSRTYSSCGRRGPTASRRRASRATAACRLRCRRRGSRDRACARSSRSRGRSRRSTARAAPTCGRTPSRPVCQLVLSACRASMRSVTFSPPPPTQISGSCWIGFGSQYAPSNARCLPWYVTVSSVQSRFTTSSVSSRICSRVPALGNGIAVRLVLALVPARADAEDQAGRRRTRRRTRLPWRAARRCGTPRT